jgi:hypothetical protein
MKDNQPAMKENVEGYVQDKHLRETLTQQLKRRVAG